MKIRFRLSMLISTLVVFCLTMMFLVNNPQKSLAQDASTLTIAFAQEPDTLNTYYSTMSFATWANYLLQANLYDYDDKLQPVPVLLKEIPTGENGGISKDGLTLTLHLKPGLKWSDGKPITAHDVKFTFDMCLDKANNFVQCAQQNDPDVGIASVKEVDATTVEIKTKVPNFPENILAVTSSFYPLPSHIFEPIYKNAVAHPATAAPTAVGTEQPAAPPGLIQNADESLNPTVFSGPYTLKEWKRGESLTFAANPNYVFGAPKIKTVVIKIFPDPQTQYAALASGQVDYVPNLQPPDTTAIGKLFSNPKDVTFFNIPGGFVEALWINQFKDGTGPRAGAAALKDPVVRHAIELAINRKGLVKDLLLDQTIPLETFYTATPYEDKSTKFVDYDAAAAEKMLDAAGYVKGSDGVRAKGDVRLEFTYATTTSAVRKKNQIYIQQNLDDIGIKVNLQTYDPTTFFNGYSKQGIVITGAADINEYANNGTITNPDLGKEFSCAQVVSDKNPGGQNEIGYCNPEFDKAENITGNPVDAKAGLQAAYDIQKLFVKDLPIITLYARPDIYAYTTARFAKTPHIGAGITNQFYDIVNWELK